MILIYKSVSFKVEAVICDKGGRYLIVQGTMMYEKMHMINTYALNDDNHKILLKSVFTNRVTMMEVKNSADCWPR